MDSFPAYGHSVIRGLVTYRLMVRREPCYLIGWITFSCAHIAITQMTQTFFVITAPIRCHRVYMKFYRIYVKFSNYEILECWK